MKERKAIATINTEIGQMTIFYNGNGEELTAETANGETVEKKEYIPESLEDAIATVQTWYASNPEWGLNMLMDRFI